MKVLRKRRDGMPTGVRSIHECQIIPFSVPHRSDSTLDALRDLF